MARIYSNVFGGRTSGTSSADEIYGSNFYDLIYGGGGNDIIDAGLGNDTINGGAGRDIINGGFGNDTVTYSTAPATSQGTGVYVNLADGVGYNSDAEGDSYISIENVTGSNYTDSIYGNNGNNVLNGLGGDDYILGGGGADTMDGGAGRDSLLYWNSTSGVTVNLLSNTSSGGHAQDDVFQNFESVMGSDFSDTLTGTNGGNDLWGHGDNDFLFGLGGLDNLLGGAGDDTMHGGSGDDRLFGETGSDILTGGLNADIFEFNINGIGDGQNPGFDFIMDFEDGVDRMRFDVATPANGMAELTFTDVGVGTLITYDDASGGVTLFGVSAAQLTAADFAFV